MADLDTKQIVYAMANLWPIPEKAKEAKKILFDLVPEAKKDEACLKYELLNNKYHKCQVSLYQAWSTEQALDEHLNGELIKKVTEELRSLLEKPTEIIRYKNIA
ncbi:unnamed protein product [Adineta steineri]|uniref:ABM domain-containing protein n=1 Tax=Adineta steineri TaxID=433720 RepID=A0A814UFF2_9BILA|nr:unnamed protein product [Adineta steineri]CAF0885479.1 unnamed protein product [Adineta steineri]CAF0996521.1 unnamed protein product [Adineta steineri]CAF1000849.1 unnamed protein product [Adineta steineri]CAF1174158.1 unnamed protein product [Adineta steineri]